MPANPSHERTLALAKLNQILAVEKGVKASSQRAVTDAYHTIQKPPLLSGLSRTYQPIDDEGEQLPPESTRVQVKAEEVLAEVGKALTKLFDVTATKDWTNTVAKADVVVDGQPLIEGAPVTYLLFLEKQLVDLHTLISKLPTLDPAETQPRPGRGDRQAPGAGAGVHRGHRRRLLDQDGLLRRPAGRGPPGWRRRLRLPFRLT
ncbi:hypothetical protein MF672_028380 [Actinomadura sp. ATCC 31491]|uniref:Uncharacterized protein n=1 Tax=Actinomadura luzonensis TaxID=2805427 RepID=A0ABT0G0M0_9ACTN|nr:hypothetical protein [Actinomadura luzonensis]MCK2217681.1 hypothetical protein [Actinomadura luzonensis]